jgi:excisionase family DNA binding protein
MAPTVTGGSPALEAMQRVGCLFDPCSCLPAAAPWGVGVASPPKLLYTASEAAALLSISRTKVYELMGSGELAFVRLGRLRRLPAAALNEFVSRELMRQGFV